MTYSSVNVKALNTSAHVNFYFINMQNNSEMLVLGCPREIVEVD